MYPETQNQNSNADLQISGTICISTVQCYSSSSLEETGLSLVGQDWELIFKQRRDDAHDMEDPKDWEWVGRWATHYNALLPWPTEHYLCPKFDILNKRQYHVLQNSVCCQHQNVSVFLTPPPLPPPRSGWTDRSQEEGQRQRRDRMHSVGTTKVVSPCENYFAVFPGRRACFSKSQILRKSVEKLRKLGKA